MSSIFESVYVCYVNKYARICKSSRYVLSFKHSSTLLNIWEVNLTKVKSFLCMYICTSGCLAEKPEKPKNDPKNPNFYKIFSTKFETNGLENRENYPQNILFQWKFLNLSLVFKLMSRGQNNSSKAVNIWLKNGIASYLIFPNIKLIPLSWESICF